MKIIVVGVNLRRCGLGELATSGEKREGCYET
jgi:hypothetical protein